MASLFSDDDLVVRAYGPLVFTWDFSGVTSEEFQVVGLNFK
jgi:hypothetical protein